MGLAGLPAQRFRHTTDSTHGQPVAPNVLARDFGADHPNERWTTDITYIWTWEGWLYLAVVLDLYARRVVGWAVQPHLQTALALEALQMALGRRVPVPGLMHHSDRGCQYADAAYQRVLRDLLYFCNLPPSSAVYVIITVRGCWLFCSRNVFLTSPRASAVGCM